MLGLGKYEGQRGDVRIWVLCKVGDGIVLGERRGKEGAEAGRR